MCEGFWTMAKLKWKKRRKVTFCPSVKNLLGFPNKAGVFVRACIPNLINSYADMKLKFRYSLFYPVFTK